MARINKEAKPELKEAYWSYLNTAEEKDESEFDMYLVMELGKAFANVITEEDLPRAFDYMNKQRSFKLIELLTFYKERPPTTHKYASMVMLEQIIKCRPPNMTVYFIKRYKEVKDPDFRRSFLEMAPKYGLTNYPEPFYP